MALKISSPAFEHGQGIPVPYTGDGADHSPPLVWEAPPPGTRSLVLLVEDPDAPRGTWVHWVLFNLPPDALGLDEGVRAGTLPTGAVQGRNDFGKLGYGGPAPPAGKPHRYFFRLYALDTTLSLPSGSSHAQVTAAMHGHVLAQGELMGTYQRRAQ
jgi:Raf kinase inhibitor-like YbhB/YbcL family protein